jgi:uncharacterized protein (DUF885 family)
MMLTLVGCNQQTEERVSAPPTGEAPQAASTPRASGPSLEEVASEYMAQARKLNPLLDLLSGKPLTRLPDQSYEAQLQKSQMAQDLLARLQQLERSALNHEEQITAAMMERELGLTIEATTHYWQFFSVTPYQAGFVFSTLPVALQAAPLNSSEDVDTYLGLLADIGRFVKTELAKLEGQSERGVLLPQAAVPGVRGTFASLEGLVPTLASIEPGRTSELAPEDRQRLESGVERLIDDEILPAVEGFLAYLDQGYLDRAPVAVGLGQYPGGMAAYRFAIRRETTLDLTPEEIHQQGLDWMADIQREMKAIRDGLGFEGGQLEFHDRMRADPQFYAETPEEVEERFMAYIREIEPFIPEYFSLLPEAPYGVKRLDPASEAGMTFGYYQAPNALSQVGNYRYNGSQLDARPMVWTGPLIFHELIPGHHFHFALQTESDRIPDVRKRGTFIAAFNEGWGNYGASLAVEMGILDDPFERYGWLLFNSFITARLVVDTGMNAFGWSLDRARQYMLDNTFSSETEVATESLRYSTDMPAQALAYKLGFEKIKDIRAASEAAWGEDFDIRVFHAAAVGSGAMPMPILEAHVRWYLDQHLPKAP